MDCIFCQIAASKIPADILHKDDDVIAFRDINPQAPVHILIIPGEHISSLAQVTEAESSLIARMVSVANEMARQEGVAESGHNLDEVRLHARALLPREFLIVAANYCVGELKSDFNGDCQTDLLDFALLTANWLKNTNPYPDK